MTSHGILDTKVIYSYYIILFMWEQNPTQFINMARRKNKNGKAFSVDKALGFDAYVGIFMLT